MERDRELWTLNDKEKRLLEAAPEMLEALQIVRITLQQIIKNNPLNIAAKNDLQRIEAAIQKAEGGR
jgi:hypothetical protein